MSIAGLRRGFTLPELLVVCAILAVLVTAIIPAVNRYRQGERLTACAARIGQIGKACLEFEKAGVSTSDDAYFTGVAVRRNVLPWRNLRAIQKSENLPNDWADPLCVRKLTFFVRGEKGDNPVSTLQGLGHLFPSFIRESATLYCPGSPVWTARTGMPAADGSAYATYCSREGGYEMEDRRAVFNTYSSRSLIAFLSCASFMGYRGHPGGWNVWYTDGHAAFVGDTHGTLSDLSPDEWFDMPKGYPPTGRWSFWVHLDENEAAHAAPPEETRR